MKEPTAQISAAVPQSLKALLQAEAARRMASESFLIRSALALFLGQPDSIDAARAEEKSSARSTNES